MIISSHINDGYASSTSVANCANVTGSFACMSHAHCRSESFCEKDFKFKQKNGRIFHFLNCEIDSSEKPLKKSCQNLIEHDAI